MANKRWYVTFDDVTHSVELKFNQILGRCTILLDGKVAVKRGVAKNADIEVE